MQRCYVSKFFAFVIAQPFNSPFLISTQVHTLELLLNDKVGNTDCVDGTNNLLADLLTSSALGGTSVRGMSPPPTHIGIALNTPISFFWFD